MYSLSLSVENSLYLLLAIHSLLSPDFFKPDNLAPSCVAENGGVALEDSESSR